MTVEQTGLRIEKSDELVLPDLFARPSMVDDGRIRCNDRPKASSPRSHTEIRLLAVHEEVGIEAAKRLPVLALQHEEASGDDFNLSDGIPRPTTVTTRIEEA